MRMQLGERGSRVEVLPSALKGSHADTGSMERVGWAGPRGGRLCGWDYAGMMAGVLLCFAVTVVNSRGRIFWEDEWLGWLLLTDSWRHMVYAWNAGADGGGMSFYLLGRGWFGLFGASAISFRMFSSTAFGLGFATVWAALRRFYPTWVVALALFNTWFFCPPFAWHLIEGRFYGLLVLSTALAMYLALRLSGPERVPARLYVAVFGAHALLTTSHVLGVVYSGFLVAAMVGLDRLERRVRVGLYASAMCAWLLLIPERRSIAAAARVGKPHFWTRAPRVGDVVGAYTGFSREIQIALLLLAVGLGAAAWGRRAALRSSFREAVRERLPVYVTAGALLLAPVAFLVEGFWGTWLFNDRYLAPETIAVACVTAEMLYRVRWRELFWPLERRRGLGRVVGFGALGVWVASLLFWEFHHVAQLTREATEFTAELTEHLPKGVPVVCEDALTFTSLVGREYGSGVRYVFLLDWEQALKPDAPRMEVTQYHLMQNWKTVGYFADAIEDFGRFVRENPRFLVVHTGEPHEDVRVPREAGNPLAQRFAANPAYEVRQVYALNRLRRDTARETVYLVCRGGCGAWDPMPTNEAESTLR